MGSLHQCSCSHLHTQHSKECCRQIELAIEPATAHIYFSDEAYVDPINTQTRFFATIFNSHTHNVRWQLNNANGRPAIGTIDAYGLYTAPNKGMLPSGYTEVITAVSIEDPTRRACALVTLQGHGPAPISKPQIQIYPGVISLYFQDGTNNAYMDRSNKTQRFRYMLKNSPLDEVEWVTSYGTIDPNGQYFTPLSGSSTSTATVTVSLKHDPAIKDTAFVTLLNYTWPAI